MRFEIGRRRAWPLIVGFDSTRKQLFQEQQGQKGPWQELLSSGRPLALEVLLEERLGFLGPVDPCRNIVLLICNARHCPNTFCFRKGDFGGG